MVLPAETEERVKRRALSVCQEHLRKVLDLTRKVPQMIDYFMKNDKEKARQLYSDIRNGQDDVDKARRLVSQELAEIEKLANEEVAKDLPVYFKEMPKKEAEKIGALAFFKEKYPETVKVYFIGPENDIVSKEFCGGPHVESTGQIGQVKVLKEESVGKGTRRIRATVI